MRTLALVTAYAFCVTDGRRLQYLEQQGNRNSVDQDRETHPLDEEHQSEQQSLHGLASLLGVSELEAAFTTGVSHSPALGRRSPAMDTTSATAAETSIDMDDPTAVAGKVMSALRNDGVDGCQTAIDYCSEKNAAKKLEASSFFSYLQEPYYKILSEWDEIEFQDGEVLNDDGSEIDQAALVKRTGDDSWSVVHWKMSKESGAWLMDGMSITPNEAKVKKDDDDDAPEEVEVKEPEAAPASPRSEAKLELDTNNDGKTNAVYTGPDLDNDGIPDFLQQAAEKSPAGVVGMVMRALRKNDEPYAMHGCEVAIGLCSSKNEAANLSPSQFNQYMQEPGYAILSEWDEIQIDDDFDPDIDDDDEDYDQEALVKRKGDADWTVVSWTLSKIDDKWLLDGVTISE